MAKGRKTGGRSKGTPNRTTVAARDLALEFLNGIDRDELTDLWKAAKGESATRAMALWFGALEFVMPKLGRTEVTGEGGGPLRAVFRIEEPE
jgi:hypothetical protein